MGGTSAPNQIRSNEAASLTGDDALQELQVFFGRNIDVVPAFDGSTGARGDMRAEHPVAGGHQHLLREVLDVSFSGEESGFSVADDFACAGNIARNQRLATGLRLEIHTRTPFTL